MTRENAIKYIEQHNHIDDEVKDMCIEALEKQIPKKPKKQIRGVYNDDNGDYVESEVWNMSVL